MLRGDHRVNEIKLRNALGERLPPRPPGGGRADRPRGLPRTGRRGRPDPARRRRRRPAPTSPAPTGPTRTCAASSPGATSPFETRRRPQRRGRRHGRTATRSGSSRRSRSATSSSSARATPSRSARRTSTRAGSEQLIWMGSYGIGPARIAAAAVEQFADEQGISWPRAIAPFDVELVGLGKPGSDERELAERLYDELRAAGLDVLYDDRDAGAGSQVRRRRAARRAAAADRRPAHARRPARSRSRCGAGASSAACRSRAPRPRRRTCGAASRRARPADLPAPLGARPLRPAAAADAGRPAAAPVDDPERDRLRPARADPRLPGARVLVRDGHRRAAGGHLRGDRVDGLPRRDRRARDRPVLAPRHAARPARRPAARALRRRRVLALRAAPALGAGAARRCARSCMLVLVRVGMRHGIDLKVNWLGRAGVWPVHGRALLRDGERGVARRGVPVRRARARAGLHGAVRGQRRRRAITDAPPST